MSVTIPSIRVPAYDSQTGLMTSDWYRYLFYKDAKDGGLGSEDIALLASAAAIQGVSAQDFESEKLSQAPDYAAIIFEMFKRIDSLELRLAMNNNISSEIAEVKKNAHDIAIGCTFQSSMTDWEHPGSIGFRTPNAGAFTTLNGNIWTAGTGTLTIAAGKTLTANNKLTLVGTDDTTITFPSTSATVARTDASNTFNGTQTISSSFGTTTTAVDIKNSTAASASNIVKQAFWVADSFNGLVPVASISVLNPTAGANTAGNIIFSTSNAGTALNEIVRITQTGVTIIGGATFLTTSSALTNGAGAGAGTITNAPAAGNPTKWIGINDNGTTRYIPAW